MTLAVLFAVPAASALAGTGQHAAITISSNAGFATCGCVTSGTGTAASPYVIGPWAIDHQHRHAPALDLQVIAAAAARRRAGRAAWPYGS